MSTEKEKRIDREAAQFFESRYGLIDDAELAGYVNRIGQALAKFSPRQDVRYHFHIIRQQEPNAFALPGGHIYITMGLLALSNSEIDRTSRQLASVHTVRNRTSQPHSHLVTNITKTGSIE